MIAYIIVAVISLAAGIFFGMAIQARRSTREIKKITNEMDNTKKSVRRSMDRAESLDDMAEDLLKESETQVTTLKEQLGQTVEKHRVILKEFQDFKNNLETVMRKLAKEVKKTPFNPNLFSRVLKDVGDGNLTLKGDGYDFSNHEEKS